MVAGVAAQAAGGHAHGLAHEADAAAAAGRAGREAEHALDAGGQPEAEAREERRQRAARDQGHDDEHEDLERVALRPVDEVAQEALELLVGARHEVGARRALVVGGGAAWEGFC